AHHPEAERLDPLLARGERGVLRRSPELELRRRLEEDARVHEPHEREGADADGVQHRAPPEEADQVAARRRDAPDVDFRVGAVFALARSRHGLTFARLSARLLPRRAGRRQRVEARGPPVNFASAACPPPTRSLAAHGFWAWD